MSKPTYTRDGDHTLVGTRRPLADDADLRPDSLFKKKPHVPAEPLEMYLCEANAVVLKPQTYRFVVHPYCDLCKRAEIDGRILPPPATDERLREIREICLMEGPPPGADSKMILIERVLDIPRNTPDAQHEALGTQELETNEAQD